jgi:hypothetical protein
MIMFETIKSKEECPYCGETNVLPLCIIEGNVTYDNTNIITVICQDKLFLRTSVNGISYDNFKRKSVGQWNKTRNWTGIANCNQCGGFFGIDKEFNGFGLLPRSTIELCEWRGIRVPIDNDKICVSEYRVIATNEDITDSFFEECNYKVLREGSYIEEISDGKWIIFGGKIGKITGGIQYFWNESTAGNAEITGGHQCFMNESTAGNAIITGGSQNFYDKSTAGNAEITGGRQFFGINQQLVMLK